MATSAGYKSSITFPISTTAWKRVATYISRNMVHSTKTLPNTMKGDTEAIGFVLKCLKENNLFDLDRDKQLLESFSTVFTSILQMMQSMLREQLK